MMGFRLIPYLQRDGAYTLNDTTMYGIFKEISENGVLKQVYYDGSVKTPEEWLIKCKDPNNVLHTVWDVDSKRLGMVAWLNGIGPNYATCHQFCMPWTWGKHTKEMGKMTLDYWFGMKRGDTYILDTIMGRTPEHLRAATIYLRKVGLQVLGTIPHIAYDYYSNKSVGLIISYITRELWNEKNNISN